MSSRFRILGRTRLRIGDRYDDQWAHPKPRGILGVLLLQPGRAWPIDLLRDWVWPDGIGPVTSGAFYKYSSRIREALERMPDKPDLVARNGTLRLDVNRSEIDYFEFRNDFDQAQRMLADGDYGRVRETMSEALQLWDDPPLADAQGQSAHDWRRQAHLGLLIPAHDLLMKALAGLGRFEDVLRHLADLPVEQRVSLTLIKRRLEALFGVGRDEEAADLNLSTRRKLKADGNLDEADDLLRFYNELDRRGRILGVGEPAGAPPSRAPTTDVPRLLPHDVKEFAGREAELRRLDAMATTTTGELMRGIAVLHGPAGVGKTALAVHWAHRVARRFPGGQLHVDLRGFSQGTRVESADVVDRFLSAMGISVEQIPHTPARVAKLRQLLSRRQTLVLLDNAYDSGHVLPMLDYLSDCLVVITSRRRLTRIGGASAIAVDPLSYQEARPWLAEQVGARAAADPGCASELTALCGGIPLALSGVADHVVARPRVRLGEFVDELRDASALLSLGDDGDGPDASLRTVFSWSYRALPPQEQRLFRLLGVHPGPDISLAVASALSGTDPQATKRGLDALVNMHLIGQAETRSRYRFHDLLRKFAGDCGAGLEYRAERLAAEDRLLGFYLHTAGDADRTVFPNQPPVEVLPLPEGVTPLEFADDESAMTWCVRERANLNAIVTHAAARGRHDYASRIPYAAGEILIRAGFYDDALSGLTTAVESARIAGDLAAESDALANLGFVSLRLNELDSAERYLQAAEELSHRVGDQEGTAIAVHHLATVAARRGRFAVAIEMHLEALHALRRAAAKGPEIIALSGLAETCRRAGQLAMAMTYGQEGLWRAEQLGDESGQARCLTELGAICHELGEPAMARGYCTRSIALNERLRDSAELAKAYNLLAAIHLADGDYAAAEDVSRKALTFSRSARDAKATATGWHTHGQALDAQARQDESRGAYHKALDIFENLGDPLADSVRARLGELPAVAPTVPAGRTEPIGSRINPMENRLA